MKTLYLRSFAPTVAFGLMLLATSASGWEFSYLHMDVVGYAHAGAVWPNGFFQTNLVPVPPNTLTNLGARGRGATSTNELLLELGPNSIAGQQWFDLESGCRACFLARGGVFVRELTFRLLPASGESEDALVSLRLTMQSFPTNSGIYSHAEVQFSLCEWADDQATCSNLVSAVVTITNTAGPRGFTNDLTLRIGRTFRLTCLLTAGTGINGEIPTFNQGINSFSLQPGVLLAIAMSQSQPRLCVKGWPGRSYALERSSDLSAWQPLMTNSAPTGAFEYVDETAANAPSRFYRAVERPSPE
jgi:hypothetical protein